MTEGLQADNGPQALCLYDTRQLQLEKLLVNE